MKIKYAICIFFVLVICVNMIFAQGNNSKAEMSSGDDMLELLARLINAEARGESYTGQVAVGAVVMNRVKSPAFPNTIAGVIYQKNQFSCVPNGQINAKIDENSSVYKAAQDAMNGVDPTNGAIFFFNPSKTKDKFLSKLKRSTTIGNHVFAKEQ